VQHITQQASQLMQKADAEIAALKAQLAQQQAKLDDKGGDLKIKDYDAETRRLAAVGNIDPTSLAMVVRQMVRDMMQTDIVPMLQNHAALESGLQATMAPPAPNGGGNGSAPPAGPPGAGNGGMGP
jgi:hypothetical protein